MIPPLIKQFTLGSTILFLLLACSSDSVQETASVDIQEAQIQVVQAYTIPTSDQLSPFFDIEEAASINRIKQVFDKGLKGSSTNRALPYIYKDHAQRMRMDYFNKYPYTLNYPYNDKFDLSLVQEEITNLSFLSKKCGFQKEDTDTIIYYYCFKHKGTFINFLKELGMENSLIANLHKDYISKKHISKEVKQLLLMNSQEELDFQQLEHQLVYMFFQILINEERLATNKL